MKKLLLLSIACFSMAASYAQVPRNPNNRNYLQQAPKSLVARGAADSLAGGATDIDQPDSVRVEFIGVAGAAAVDELKKASAGVSFGVSVSWGRHQTLDKKYRMYQRNSFYMLFNPATLVSNDTTSKLKTFLFPEISKRDFVIGYERLFPFSTRSQMTPYNNESRPMTFSGFVELSTSHYDTGANRFRSYCGTLGVKLTYHNSQSGLPFGFQIIPNYSLVTVEAKDWNAMNMSLLGKTSADLGNGKGVPPTVHTLGVNFKASLSVFEIFANFKYVLNGSVNNNLNIPGDMKNTVAIFGILVNPDVWGFNVARGPGNTTRPRH